MRSCCGQGALSPTRVMKLRCAVSRQIAKSSSVLPDSMAAVIHFGLSPRPDHVEPEVGSRYFAATFEPGLSSCLPRTAVTRSAAVNPCADINSRTLAIASDFAVNCASRIWRSSDSFCAIKSLSVVIAVDVRLQGLELSHLPFVRHLIASVVSDCRDRVPKPRALKAPRPGERCTRIGWNDTRILGGMRETLCTRRWTTDEQLRTICAARSKQKCTGSLTKVRTLD